MLTIAGFPAVALRSCTVEVVAVPGLGMKLTSLRRPGGREWLWHNDQLPFAAPTRGASYVETADSGGWDECFPNVGVGPRPGAPPGTPPLPDHGELWSAQWTSSVREHAEGVTLAGFTESTILPCTFYREVTVDAREPVVRFRYRLQHTGSAPFAWIWSAHPLLSVRPGTAVELPGVQRVKVDAAHGRGDLERGDVVSWPEAVGGTAGQFVYPVVTPAGARWAGKFFGELPRDGPGRMIVTDPVRGERLEITVRPNEVPHVGLWINCGGWAPPGRLPYYNLGVEPCIGAPDRLDDAVLHWKQAQTLIPGEERSWGLELRLTG